MKGNSKVKTYGIIVLTAILLILSVYFNYRMNREEDDALGVQTPPQQQEPAGEGEDITTGAGMDYFAAFRETRERERAKEIEYLNLIIDDERTDSERLQDAQEQLMSIVEGMEQELTLEQLLLAKGFKDVAVTVHKGSINVIVDAQTLEAEQVAQILEIVIRETGEQAGNIKVANKRRAEGS